MAITNYILLNLLTSLRWWSEMLIGSEWRPWNAVRYRLSLIVANCNRTTEFLRLLRGDVANNEVVYRVSIVMPGQNSVTHTLLTRITIRFFKTDQWLDYFAVAIHTTCGLHKDARETLLQAQGRKHWTVSWWASASNRNAGRGSEVGRSVPSDRLCACPEGTSHA